MNAEMTDAPRRRSAERARPFWAFVRPAIPWAIILLGALLRVNQYAYDRSLFLDEAMVATNISDRSFAGLLKPLQYDQRAPAGFLICEKAATVLFGQTDLALRLFPLICGVASLPMLFWVARGRLSESGVACVLLLFALAPPLVFLSSDLKQYSTDALATLAILLALSRESGGTLSLRRALVLGVVGGAALWFSFPAAFVLTGVGCAWALDQSLRRRWDAVWRLAPAVALWAVGFAALYAAQIGSFAHDPGWKHQWDEAFMPLPPRSLRDLFWFAQTFIQVVTVPVGLTFGGLAGLSFLLGVRHFLQRSVYEAGIIVCPCVAVLMLSGLRVYPCSGRAIVFLAPLVLLAITAGIDSLRRCPERIAVWAGTGLALLLLFHPAGMAAARLAERTMYKNTTFYNYKFEEIKPLMAHVRGHWQPGDLVYLYSDSRVAFKYYAKFYGFKQSDYVEGIQSALMNPAWGQVEADLQRLRGRPRVWVLFTHTWDLNGVDDQRLFLYFLDKMGRRVDSLKMPEGYDAAVYLYDLSEPRSKPEAGADQR